MDEVDGVGGIPDVVQELIQLVGATPHKALLGEKAAARCPAVQAYLCERSDSRLGLAEFIDLNKLARVELTRIVSEASGELPDGVARDALCLSLSLRLDSGDDEALGKRKKAAAKRSLNRSTEVFRPVPAGRITMLAEAYADALLYCARKRNASLKESSPAWVQLERRSLRYQREVLGAGDIRVAGATGELVNYISRDIQGAILRAVDSESDERPILIRGDAGSGKSTLLIWLHHALKRQSLVLSATWFVSELSDERLAVADVIDVVKSARPILLIDTADLLLRTEHDAELFHFTMDTFVAHGFRMVVTSRPRETSLLVESDFRVFELREYADSEAEQAAEVLCAQFCPEAGVTDPAERLRNAVSRGLIVPQVRRNPLLVRMLFQVAAPDFPNLDVDITELYQRYWDHRIARDLRFVHDRRRYTTGNGDRDLTQITYGIGLSMLAHGDLHIPMARVRDRLGQVELTPQPYGDIDDGAKLLVMRGVLLDDGTLLRFFHQTIFEFAVAKALGSRDPEREFVRLVDYLLASPHDIFVAAILEQFVVYARYDFTETTIAGQLVRLLSAPSPQLKDTAIRILAATPQLVGMVANVLQVDITEIGDGLLDTFCRNVIAYKRRQPEQALDVLFEFAQHRSTQQAALTAIGFLARRHPAVVATMLTADLVDAVIATNPQVVQSQTNLLELAESVRSVDSDTAVSLIVRALHSIKRQGVGRNAMHGYLEFCARYWEFVGSDRLIQDLTYLFSVNYNDSDAAAVRRWLGKVFAAHLIHDGTVQTDSALLHYVNELCAELENDDEGIVAGARLSAVCQLAGAGTIARDVGVKVLARLFSLTGRAAPYQLQRGALANLLESECSLRSPTIGLLASRLGGITSHDEGRRTWAEMARSCVGHENTPDHVFTEIVRRSGLAESPEPWLRREQLIKLAPRGGMLGIQGAIQALKFISDDPSRIADPDANVFIDGAKEWISSSAAVCSAFLALLGAVNRPATLSDFISRAKARGFVDFDFLRAHSEELRGLVNRALRGEQSDQEKGARLWRLLIEANVVEATPEVVAAAVEGITRSTARAQLIALWSIVSVSDDSARARLMAHCVEVLVVDTGSRTICARHRRIGPAEVDTTRRAWLAQLAAGEPVTADLPIVATLALAKWATTGQYAPTAVGDAGFLMIKFAKSGKVDEAWELFDAIATGLQANDFKRKQARTAANLLKNAIGALSDVASTVQVKSLCARLPDMADSVGEFTVNVFSTRHWGLMNSEFTDNVIAALGERTRNSVLTQRRSRSNLSSGAQLSFVRAPA
ncbi:hypothetical protein K3M35_16915 [Rhodococcus sp. DMU2021]|uniref:NACHT domain-containing protein n=1 Tax=Rhodococcus sp. DMU2021 TaxID=2866997 RepID=UPI001C7D4EA1|nr:hypothetical protein [Rhodococcus sp. DMU2021]MBX4170319.1 hypothetical protein [Rhodococcus sp. DMU2021]